LIRGTKLGAFILQLWTWSVPWKLQWFSPCAPDWNSSPAVIS
jgi:hypothetical protein